MLCTSRLYQKDQGIVIGWKQSFLQRCGHWSITFQTWLVLGNSVIKLSDIFHQWGQIYGYESILYFPVFITTILNLGRVSHNQKIKYRNRYLPQSFMPSVPCILPKMPLPPNLHCIAETYFLEEPKNFLIKLKKLSFKLAP